MDEKQLTDQAERLLSLTFHQAAEVIHKGGHLGVCRNCAKGSYALSKYDNRATVVCLSIVPTNDELAHWAFYAACNHCGEVKLIDAAHVLHTADVEA